MVSPFTTANISSSTPPQPSSSIPLRSISPNSRPSTEQSTSLLESAAEKQGTGRPSSSSSSSSTASDFSVWSDTGDLAEQLANEEDPLHAPLYRPPDDETDGPAGSEPRSKKPKRVHYAKDVDDAGADRGLDKEIEIPVVAPRRISRAERILAAIMTPRNQGSSKTHGFVGKPLLYVSPPPQPGLWLRCADHDFQIFYKCLCIIRGFPLRL